ncbi:leucine-rich repeat domain-containing protein [Mesomycoplasma ovipneumoniae]|uniref:Leucine-rich repeat domain-containing protein n=1 Tax=Mesomycoplasma ovipneumoniae TaxID=29562 RepID=A0AAJ2P5S4_9BACT|nr:leucine-rich repeat domain-containing protein [Mesomycoplasma ovipneumoniae]MDW2835256.1 leucine-rich repeat domain-containing protein [Mesomycoplasma ovipneumoniae]MDW2852350.1 leucine-rich repeat domain-containing protein [Mesomycoplasma ovipneumoniae]MDW2861915.1 leucine-rich repeat domain-containing protein [Mesomycoplasma ovipneumoniae]MDW2892379.1 leucine-rich repeat domain-containing protein [Mesomycoplasma ovipneumoniae]MDW2908543.1 leucine-rich repeat domain-containing protein [Mes
MFKFKKILKTLVLLSPIVALSACTQTPSQAEQLLASIDKTDSKYVKIDESTNSFVLDLTDSGLTKIDKSAFFSLKSRIFQKTTLQNQNQTNQPDQPGTENTQKPQETKVNFYFLSKIIFPETLTEIEDYAFYADSANLTDQEKIKELDFSKATNLKKIGNFAFQGNNITKLVLPSSLVSIGRQAFAKNNLEQVDFSNSKDLEIIQTGAFFDNKIKNVDFSQNVKLIEIFSSAFESNKIETVKFNKSAKPVTIGTSAFKENVIKTNENFENIPDLSSLNSPFN